MLWGLKVWTGSKAIRWIHDRYFHVRLLSMIRGTGNPWTTIYWKMKDCWRAGQRGRIALAKRMVHSFAKCPVSTTTRNGSSREGSGGSLLFVPFPYLYTLVRSSKASKPSLLWSWTVPALFSSEKSCSWLFIYQWPFAGPFAELEPVLQVWLYQCSVGRF